MQSEPKAATLRTAHTPKVVSNRAINKLDDTKVRAHAKKGLNVVGRKLSDGAGLYLTITPAGSAVWRIAYRFGGKDKTSYTVGPYPGFSLKAARDERDKVKAWLRAGRNPVQERRIARVQATASSGNTFRELAEAWLEKERKDWSAIHYTKSKRALERDVVPRLGPLPVAEITPAMVTGVIEAMLKRGVRDTAAKVLQHITSIFMFAQSKGILSGRENPALPAQEALPKAKRAKGRPALLTFPELGDVLRRAEAARLSPAVRMAHRLCAFAPGSRISNIVAAEWPEFDLDSEAPAWIVPRKKMKAHDRHHDHRIILPRQIAEELRQWRSVIGGKGCLFPSPAGGKQITRESIEKAYRVTLGLEDKHSPHGWRAAFSTLARDHGFDREVVELTLDHVHDNDIARAYDRGERLEKRIKLMKWWGEQLVQAQLGAAVVPLRTKASA
jgi:integrase